MGTQHRWIWLFLFVLIKVIAISSKELRVVCYYTNWSVYRPGNAKFSPQNINPYLCTHLVYAFGGFTKENTLKPFDKYQDIEKGGYAKFTGLKTYNKNLKTMLAIGGWNEGSSRFSPMVASAERRKELVKNVVKFLRQNHFDGLDLDWEYPSFRDGGKSRDKDNYAQLVQELREEFDRESKKTGRPRLLLTMAVPAGIEYINKGYDVPKLMKYLDWMNILSYDYHSAFEPSVNHHAPLYPLEEDNEYNYDADLNIEHTIQHYLKAGAISDKLVLGIPTYGRSYTLFNPDATDIGAPADGPGEMGDATRENGYLAYYEICEAVNAGEWTVVQPNEDAMGPYAYKENQWVGYDDEAIARKKSQYVADKDLGGIMFWAIDNDDFRGSCHNKSYPIIEAAKEALVEAFGLGNENAIQKSTKNTKPRTSRLRNKTPSITQEPSTERTRNSGGRQGAEPTSNRRRPQGRVENGADTKPRRRRPGARKSQKSTTVPIEPASESGSSLVVTTPSWKTPEPPTTPDPAGGDFKCEDEGFYPHPRDCKKYFWCLNGPSELGIIAHQFTCPAGLFFNKAASSCDYTQNVLCNKKPKTTTTTTTTPLYTSASTTTTEEPTKRPVLSIFSTRRPPPRITAATSRTTFVSTTASTTPEYDDEYEEYEDEDPKETNDNEADSEDPQVIKELLELIKKAGGIEELEKQLNIKDDASTPSQSGSTTASPIKQALYQRVLAKTKLTDPTTRQNSVSYTTLNRNRNSRGPQNEGLDKEEKTAKSISRPKYSTISRTRTSKVEESDSDDREEEEEETVIKEVPEVKEVSRPKYISLRRNRVSTTAAPVEDDVEEDPVKRPELSTTSRSPYVTLRRSRPITSTTRPEDEPLDRDVLGENEDNNEKQEVDTAFPNYVVLNRQRSTTSTSTTSRYKEIRRSTTTTTPIPATEQQPNEEEITVTHVLPTEDTNLKVTNTLLTTISDETVGHTLSFETTTPEATTTTTTTTPAPTTTTTTTTEAPKNEIIEPQLLDPRPFSVSNIARIATPTAPTIKKFRPSTTSTTARPEPETPKVSPQSLRTRPPPVAVDSNVQTQTRGRIRGSARFTLKTDSQYSPDQQQQQLASHINSERHYRPETSRFSDLSSLTAVDFAFNVNNANQKNGGRLRSRSRTTTSTVVTHAPTSTDTLPASTTVTTPTTVTTRTTQETLKTGSRTLTLARKYLENSQFGSSRRRPTTTTTTTVSDEGVNIRIKSATDEPRVNKLRTVVRRLRPHPTTPATISTEALEVSQTRRFGGRRTTPLPYRRRQNELDAANSDDEDDENINLSESNILENSDLNRGNTNAIKDDSKSVPRKVIKRIRFPTTSTTTPSTTISTTTTTPTSAIDTENENTTDQIDEVNDVTKAISEATLGTVRSTEPNIIVRTRVILRKLSTTTAAPTPEVTESHPVEEKTRKYRIIKRIRPTTSTSTAPLTPEDEEEEEEAVTPLKTRLIPVSSNKYNPSLYTRSTTERSTTESTTPTNPTSTVPSTTTTTTSATSAEVESEIITTVQPETEQPEVIITTSKSIINEVELEQDLTEPNEPVEVETTESITEEPITSSTASTPVYTNKIYKSAEDRPKLDLKSRAITAGHVQSTTRAPLRFESRLKKPFKLRPTESKPIEDFRREEVEDVGHGTVKPFRKIEKTSNPRTFPRFGASIDDADIDSFRPISSTVRSYSRTPYRFTKGTTEATIEDDFDNDEEDENEDKFDDNFDEEEEELSNENEDEEEESDNSQNFNARPNINRPTSPRFNLNRSPKPETSTRRANTPFNPNSNKNKSVKTTTRSYKRFTSTTPVTNTADLADINVEALNQRNKQLFTKARKMNTPFLGTTTSVPPSAIESETSSQPETSTNDVTEELTTDKFDITTFSNEIEATDKPVQTATVTEYEHHTKVTTTDKPTTFYHIFAETDPTVTEHQETLNTLDGDVSNNFEKLIEVNRIVEINNGSNLDHIGVINRVTNIEVVNGDKPKGELKINISGPSIETEYLNPLSGDTNRKDRKYEIYGDSKVLNYTRQNPILVNAKSVEIIPNQILIESKSNVHTITPKPLFTAEVSTIALEGLFRTEAPTYAEVSSGDNKDGDELLETEHSRYVNVKVLDQDIARSQKAILDPKAKFVPLKILPDDTSIKAQVVEVARDNQEFIKIAPIARSRRPVSRFRPENRRTGTSTNSQLQTTASPSSTARISLRTRPTRRPITRLVTPAYSASNASVTTESSAGTSVGIRTPTRNRFRTITRRRFFGTTTTTTEATTPELKQSKQLTDQSIESTIEHSKEEQTTDNEPPKETTELTDLALALNHIQKAPLPMASSEKSPKTEREQRKYPVQTANSINIEDKPAQYPFEEQIDNVLISSPRPFLPSITSPVPTVRITTRRPKPRTTSSTKTVSRTKSIQIFDKIPSGVPSYTYKPITDYDYYDDGNPRISIPENSKVLIHSTGVIQCLDQGNFPHPVSCKKFISCAKMETGNVLGWEYTCPKNLSFDPIGGMCNWSAGLGCNE